jgi:phosphoserine aminotransferase
MYNIPVSSNLYTIGGVIKYTKEHGAVASRTEQGNSMSGLLYKAIDYFDGFYACSVDKSFRGDGQH